MRREAEIVAEKEFPFYNVNNAVGPRCTNTPTDVMLVQFFLHEIFAHPAKQNKPAGPPIQITGSCDDVTSAWIRHFQEDVKRRGGKVHIDSRVDPNKGAQFSHTPIHNAGWTIVHLNRDYRRRHRAEHNHLETHTLIPAPLKAELVRGEPMV